MDEHVTKESYGFGDPSFSVRTENLVENAITMSQHF
jgi:hypothetical protein